MTKSILFVDDEVQILRSLSRLFVDIEYTVFLAESAKQALDILQKNTIDLIVTDMRMPEMDGYQLLKAVREKHPSTIRLILSGYSDEDLILSALRNNLAKLYLFKPWDNQVLVSAISKIFETKQMFKDKDLSTFVNNLKELPVMTDTYQRVGSLIDENADIKKVTAIIEEDQSIAAKILHIANSAYYGTKIGSISQAISFLGLNNIRNIVLTTTTFEHMKCSEKCIQTRKSLLKHACLCNRVVMLFNQEILRKKLPDIWASAGLLHDIGKIALMSIFPQKYIELLDSLMNNDNTSLVNKELQVFSASHQEIGAYLLDMWELPHPIVESALYHHSPLCDKVSNKELVSLVHIADYFSWELMGIKSYNYLDENTFKYLQTSYRECSGIIQNLEA